MSRRSVVLAIVAVLIVASCNGSTADTGTVRASSPEARFRVVRHSRPFRFAPPGARILGESMATACVDPDFDRREPRLTHVVRSNDNVETVQRAIIEEFRRDGWTIDPEVNTVTISDIPPQTTAGATKQFHGWTASVALWSIASSPHDVSVVVEDRTTKYCAPE
jgi:hypothetical protein